MDQWEGSIWLAQPIRIRQIPQSLVFASETQILHLTSHRRATYRDYTGDLERIYVLSDSDFSLVGGMLIFAQLELDTWINSQSISHCVENNVFLNVEL